MVTHKTFKQSYYQTAQGSKCNVKFTGYKNPECFKITLCGAVANIPSLKNQKVANMNVLRPEAKARLVLLTDLLTQACSAKIPHYEPKVDVFCFISFSYRKVTFDEDNAATTIKDWLEPKFIRKKDRGWGVGVVPNDRHVKVYAIKKLKGDPNSDLTEIWLRPQASVQVFETEFLNRIINFKL